MYLCLWLLPWRSLFYHFLHRSMKACLASLKTLSKPQCIIILELFSLLNCSKLFICLCKWLRVAWDKNHNNKMSFLISAKIKWVNWKEKGVSRSSWNLQKQEVNNSLSSLFFSPFLSVASNLQSFWSLLFSAFYDSGSLCLNKKNLAAPFQTSLLQKTTIIWLIQEHFSFNSNY